MNGRDNYGSGGSLGGKLSVKSTCIQYTLSSRAANGLAFWGGTVAICIRFSRFSWSDNTFKAIECVARAKVSCNTTKKHSNAIQIFKYQTRANRPIPPKKRFSTVPIIIALSELREF